MVLIVPYQGKTPRISPDAFIADTAVITGDVEIAAGASIWYGTVIRGDSALIRIGERVNIQDCCVVHADADAPVTIDSDVTVGHRAIVHGASIGSGTLIGMGAVLLSRSRIGAGVIVAATSLVVEDAVIEDGVLVMGTPAHVRRPLEPAEREGVLESVRHYHQLSREYMAQQHSVNSGGG